MRLTLTMKQQLLQRAMLTSTTTLALHCLHQLYTTHHSTSIYMFPEFTPNPEMQHKLSNYITQLISPDIFILNLIKNILSSTNHQIVFASDQFLTNEYTHFNCRPMYLPITVRNNTSPMCKTTTIFQQSNLLSNTLTKTIKKNKKKKKNHPNKLQNITAITTTNAHDPQNKFRYNPKTHIII